jgi:DnaK suppressor protein
MTDAIDTEAARALLLARKAELQALTESSAGGRATVELDQTTVGRLTRMDAMQGQQMALETERRRKAELGRIEAALKRLDGGDYGYCQSCDEAIAAKRLELDPAATLCVDCAGKRSF